MSVRLRRLCTNPAECVRRYGKIGADKIELRLNQVANVQKLEDMRFLPGRLHELEGNRAGQFALDLHKGYRLIIVPEADPPPLKQDGGIDLSMVDSVIVLEIVNYH